MWLMEIVKCLANSMKDCLIVRFVKVNFQMNGRWLILLHCQNVNPSASIYNDIQPITCDVLAIYDNNIWPRLVMIIVKNVFLYFIQIRHTDDFPSTGTRLVGNNYSYTLVIPMGTICGPKCFTMYINDWSTPVPLYKYVDGQYTIWDMRNE